MLMTSLFILLINVACKKEQPYMNDAIITGSDPRMCVCCGGLMITFTNDPRPYAADYKHIENVADLGLTEKDTFPIYVKVDWKIDTKSACKPIIITRFKRR